jgi:hypothetical protein
MPIESDFTVAVNGDIRWTSGSNYTVVELHRFLQDLADDAQATGNDLLDITSPTPSVREGTDNFITLNSPYNIDDTTSQKLYDGSIVQDNGDTIYEGFVNFGTAGIYFDLIQNKALVTNFWGTSLNPDAALGISHRFLVKVRTGGADIDGRRLIATAREFNNTYSEFKINGTNRGNNTIALSHVSDLNNTTAAATVATWTGITNTEGYRLLDVDNDTVDEPYYSEWNTNQPTRTINDFYERMKWLTRRGSASTLYGVNGDLFRGITQEINVDNILSGPLNAVEELTWTEASVSSSGIMVATDSVSAPTKVWIQLTSGIVPTDGTTLTGTTSSATVDVNVTVTARNISTPWVGIATGTSIIGSYGFGVEPADLTAADTLTDLTDTAVNPPNNVTFTVFGVVSGEDRILATNNDAGAPDKDQLTLNTTLSGASETAVVCTASIPVDTPGTGTIRVELDSGIERRLTYTSYTSATFTIPSTNFTGDNATAPKNVYVTYLDLLATGTNEPFTTVYNADRTLFIRVRDGDTTPIKTFETTSVLGSAGGSATVNRQTDA